MEGEGRGGSGEKGKGWGRGGGKGGRQAVTERSDVTACCIYFCICYCDIISLIVFLLYNCAFATFLLKAT